MILAATALTMALSLMIATMVSIHNQASEERSNEQNLYSDIRR